MSPSKSIQSRLGFLFGSSLESFRSGKKPSEMEIIQHWMFHHDCVREQDLSKTIDRKAILQSVVQSVIENHKTIVPTFEATAADEKKISLRIKLLSEKAEKLAKNTRHKSNEDWIEETRSNFENLFETEVIPNTLKEALEDESVGNMHSLPSSPLPPREIKRPKRHPIDQSFDGTFESTSSKVRH